MRGMPSLFVQKNDITPNRLKELKAFCVSVKIKFRDYSLLDLAFHHRSYSNESTGHKMFNNERLEFLGDSVLGMAAASFLYKDMAEHAEGELAKIKSVVVSEHTLAPIGKSFGISGMLVLGRGEEMSGGRKKAAIIADCMEAIIGAYYLDSGYVATEKYILSWLVPEIRKVQQDKGEKDYKTLLQELCQKKYKSCPFYELVGHTGPDHDQTFSVCVHLNKVSYGPANGKSKKQAEQNAAHAAWDILSKQNG